MKINRDNYEAYFLDFAEGNLSAEEEEMLKRFLRFNPDLAEELDAFSNQEVIPQELKFPGKELLKKTVELNSEEVSEINFELFCIAFLEGDLSTEKHDAFLVFLKENPQFEETLELYRKTHLEEVKVEFPGRKQLKKGKSNVIFLRYLIPFAAAATIALMFFFGPKSKQVPIEIASTVETENSDMTAENMPEEKRPPVNNVPATLKVIKQSTIPVPVSGYKEKKQEKKQANIENQESKQSSVKMAVLNLQHTASTEYDDINYDRLVAQPVTSPTIHPGSLSATTLARYRLQKASEAVEEEDQLLFNLASSGLKGLNKLAGTNAQLIASKDESGSISGISFKSRYLNVTAPVSRNED